MQARQAIGIDLPLKVLIWEDDARRTWLSYTDPRSLADRYELSAAAQKHNSRQSYLPASTSCRRAC
jgi:uncharacterized protein (DUF302 family)